MSESEPYVRPLTAESRGEAPGRGRLLGRRVLIVGGGQQVVDPATDPVGNGRAMALLFAREGAQVAVADRSRPAAQASADLITAAGGKALVIEADIAQEADVVRMVAEAANGLGGLDGLILNVGIGVGGHDLAGVKVAEWDLVLSVNLRGPMLCCRQALPVLSDGASIVFISSVAGLTAGSRLPAYDASKAALAGLMRHVALEGAKRGVRANIVAPGLVDTPLGRRASRGRASRARTRLPFGREATGWEVAYAALFLTSDESVYITAQILAVDCGLSGIS
ncbi:MAG: SDR family NAD(P)-dependent oxidoreductase [Beijerinckiaceae bacterium]